MWKMCVFLVMLCVMSTVSMGFVAAEGLNPEKKVDQFKNDKINHEKCSR